MGGAGRSQLCAMKRMLSGISRRWGHDGWALKAVGATSPLHWTVCTTRREARELREEIGTRTDMFPGARLRVVKVRIKVEEV